MRNFKRLPPVRPPSTDVSGSGLMAGQPAARLSISSEGVSMGHVIYTGDDDWTGRSGKASYHAPRPVRLHRAGRT